MQNLILLAAAGETADGNAFEKIVDTFGVNWPLFISQCIAFLVVAFLLKKLAYKPVLEMLENRRQKIAESMDNAEKIKAELAETQAERDKVMAEANQKAEKLIADAKEAAKQVGEAEGQKAVKQAEEIIRKAREATEADRERQGADRRRPPTTHRRDEQGTGGIRDAWDGCSMTPSQPPLPPGRNCNFEDNKTGTARGQAAIPKLPGRRTT